MARKTDDRLKRILLLFFVVVSVALIIGIYATDLTGNNDPVPAFYRDAPTAVPAIELTITSPAKEHDGRNQATPTAPDDEYLPGNDLMDDV
jgi:hypothetical protein